MRPLPGIGIYAPAGLVTDPAALARAAARLAAAGHAVVVDPTCASRWQRFSAPDDERLAAVARMAADPRVELAIAARGGYGWSRLLDRSTFAALARAGKRWLGHSDFTAFQLAALAHAGMVDLRRADGRVRPRGRDAVAVHATSTCWRLLGGDRHEVRLPLDGPDVDVAGTLWGGNLALVAHLVGSRHFPRVDGGILFLEDVGEHPYRIERMLHQLHFAGVLAAQRAVLLGAFTEYATGAARRRLRPAGGRRATRGSASACPLFTGLPFGHVPDKLTLPVGGHAALTRPRRHGVAGASGYAR